MILLAGGVRILMAATAIALVYRYAARDRDGIADDHGWPHRILWLLAVGAVVLHFDFSVYPTPKLFMNAHDVYHYYMGSKYSPEVGYLNLYPCTVIADADNYDGESQVRRIRRMDDYKFLRVRHVLADADRYRALFSAPRWAEFKQDVAYFHSRIAEKEHWQRVVRDKGYNATPVWNMVAAAFSSRLPTRSTLAMTSIVSLDVILLAIAFAMVWRVFGRRAGLLAIVFFGTMFMMAYGHIRGGFLRLDWVSLLVMAICMLKVNRYKTAGALMAYAAMARIFPVVFAFGLGAKWCWDLVATRKVNRRYLDFFVMFALVIALLFSLSVLDDGGLDNWRAFWTKIRLHDNDIAPVRVGFKYVFLMTYADTTDNWAVYETAKQQAFQDRQPLWWTIQAAVILVSLFAVRKLDDYETVPYGYVLAYFLTAPTFYYHVMVLVALFLFLPKLERPARTHGVALLFGVSIVASAMNVFWKLGLTLSFALSCTLFVVCLYMVGISLSATSPDSPSSLRQSVEN